MIRLLVLSTGSPDGEGPFSGAVRNLTNALAARGAVHAKVNVNGYTDPFRPLPFGLRVLRKVVPCGLLESYAWSRMAADRRTRRALRAAGIHPGFNACLMCGTQFDPPPGVPTYCYFDGTVAQVARAGEWDFQHFSRAKVRRLVEAQRRIFNRCAALFPWAAWSADSALNDYGIPTEKICVAGVGSNFSTAPLPHVPYCRKTILFVGRDFERKGGPLIVDAFRLVRRALPDARLVLVGCAKSLDEPGVEVAGEISKNEPGGPERILKYFSEASVFCLMSRFEPFGIAVIEAQNCRVPCVVPKRFCFTETVVEGVTGRHVDDYEPRHLAAVLIEMLSNPELLEAMGKAAHEHVQNNYTWELVADRILERIRGDLETCSAEAASARPSHRAEVKKPIE